MKLYSGNVLPPGTKARQVFDTIVHTGTVDLGSRASGSIDDRSQAVREAFAAMAPEEANAAIGVQVATEAVLHDIGGGGTIYMTRCGNPAAVEDA